MSKKRVYVLLTDTGTLFTKTIKLYTRKPYNHASIAFDRNLTQVYSFGRKSQRNPFIGGFVKENIKEELLRNAKCAVYSLTINETVYNRMKQYIKIIDVQQESYRYNFIGLFAIIFNKQLDRENAFFCSQFVATVLNTSGSIDFNKPLSLVTPHDLQEIEKLELVFQGTLKDYNKVTTDPQLINTIESHTNMVIA